MTSMDLVSIKPPSISSFVSCFLTGVSTSRVAFNDGSGSNLTRLIALSYAR
jgi:hypothetical protein